MAKSISKYYSSFLKIINRYLWSATVLNKRNPFIRYSFAVSLVLVVTYFKLLFYGTIGGQAPFLLYFGVIIICTGFGGIGPGIFATILSTLVTIYFFLYPYRQLSLDHIQAVQTVVFISECLLIIALSSAVTSSGRRLQRSSKRFKALIEKSNEAIAVVDLKGKIFYASPATRKVLGYSPAELRRIEVFSKLNPDETDMLRNQIMPVLEVGNKSITVEHRFLQKNEEWAWIESTITNLLNEPAVRGIVVNFRNVTERVMLERQKDDFVSIATHELKTPVTSIKAYAQILFRRFNKEGNTAAAGMIEKMDGQLNKLIGLIGDLLDVTKIESGRLQMHEGLYAFNGLITEIAEELQRTTDDHRIILNLDSDIEIYGDRERVGQVLTNLITNAIKYSPRSKDIFVSTISNSESVTVQVKDHGIGISKESQENVFERFYRVSGPENQSFPGLGLGLYISREIIQRQGGKIWVESEKNNRSTFCFCLSTDFRKALPQDLNKQLTIKNA